MDFLNIHNLRTEGGESCMDHIREVYDRYKKGERFAEPFSEKKIRVKDPSELAANNQIVQEMLKRHFCLFTY